MLSSVATMATVLSGAALVSAHGQVGSASAGGQTNKAPNVYYSGDAANAETAIRTMYQSDSPAFVLSQDFDDPSKMSCEGSSATGAPATIKVKAGDALTVQWVGATDELLGKDGTGGASENPWVHAIGPVLDYITACDGPCSSYDATYAGWTKLAEWGIDNSQWISDGLRATMEGKPEPYYPRGKGLWGLAKLIQDGSLWTINIPSVLKSGEYIIRNELSALHNPKQSGDDTSGPQNYIACIQIEVTDGGDTTLPEGTQSGSLYKPAGGYAYFDVYSSEDAAQSFQTPGPSVWDQVSSSSSSSSKEDTTASDSEESTAPFSPEYAEVTSSSSPAATDAAAEGDSCRKRTTRRFLENHKRGLKNRLVAEAF